MRVRWITWITRLLFVLVLLWVLAIFVIPPLLSRFLPWDHRFDVENVLKLSEKEVVRRFGPPDYDPRSDGTWTNEAESGSPLGIAYYGHWGRMYVLEFRDDKVIGARHDQK